MWNGSLDGLFCGRAAYDSHGDNGHGARLWDEYTVCGRSWAPRLICFFCVALQHVFEKRPLLDLNSAQRRVSCLRCKTRGGLTSKSNAAEVLFFTYFSFSLFAKLRTTEPNIIQHLVIYWSPENCKQNRNDRIRMIKRQHHRILSKYLCDMTDSTGKL